MASVSSPKPPLPVPAPGMRLRMSYDEYLAWAPDMMFAEWKDGQVQVAMPVTDAHQRILLLLLELLDSFATVRRLGVVRSGPMVTKLWPGGPGREPDIFFVREERRHLQAEVEFLGGPDLVVEIISEDSVRRDRRDKLTEYSQAGVEEYWLIEPRPGVRRQRSLTVYRRDASGHYSPAPAVTAGVVRSRVLAGFWLRVEWLWQDPAPNRLELLTEILRYPAGPDGPEAPEALRVLPWAGSLMQTGRAEGMRALAEVALQGRFGPLPADVREAMGAADDALLMELVAALSTATLDEVRTRLGLTQAGGGAGEGPVTAG